MYLWFVLFRAIAINSIDNNIRNGFCKKINCLKKIQGENVACARVLISMKTETFRAKLMAENKQIMESYRTKPMLSLPKVNEIILKEWDFFWIFILLDAGIFFLSLENLHNIIRLDWEIFLRLMYI